MNSLIINQLGFQFDEGHDVKGRLSIADLFPKSKHRCGIYLLRFTDGTYYIGQAIDAVRRFTQHRKNYSDIESYWFQAMSREFLDNVEQKLIYKAESLGLLLTNKTFASNVIGETDLDLILNPDEQDDWFKDNTIAPISKNELYHTVDKKFITKYTHRFELLKNNSKYRYLHELMTTYVRYCIPKPYNTQLSFWSLSCLPTTKGNFSRYFCLNINAMEVFIAGQERKTEENYCFIVVSKSLLSDTYIKELKRKYSSLYTYKRSYRAAGEDQITLGFTDSRELCNCLKNELLVRQAAKHLNLRLMRKGATIYSPYHCFDLANHILSIE